jgi:SAM-dependent methyltransferase
MSDPTRPTQREYWNSKVGDEWARQADLMDAMLRPVTDAGFARLQLIPGERVLDVGCGAGATTLLAAVHVGEGGRVVGVDISRPLLALAEARAVARGGNVRFVEADVANAPIPGAPFDALFSRFGVMFFDDPVHGFTRMREALRPAGRIVFICWRPFAENGWAHAPLAALKPLLQGPVAPPDANAPGPFQLQDAARIEATLAGAGWRDVLLARWDGEVLVGGGGGADAAAAFLMKIGPCARAIAEQRIDPALAARTLTDFLRRHETAVGVSLPAACWIVRAVA